MSTPSDLIAGNELVRAYILSKFGSIGNHIKVETYRDPGMGHVTTLTYAFHTSFAISDEALARQDRSSSQMAIDLALRQLMHHLQEQAWTTYCLVDTPAKLRVYSQYANPQRDLSYFVCMHPIVDKGFVMMHPDTYVSIFGEYTATLIAYRPGEDPGPIHNRADAIMLVGGQDAEPTTKRKGTSRSRKVPNVAQQRR